MWLWLFCGSPWLPMRLTVAPYEARSGSLSVSFQLYEARTGSYVARPGSMRLAVAPYEARSSSMWLTVAPYLARTGSL